MLDVTVLRMVIDIGIAIAAWWPFSCKTDCMDIYSYSALAIFIVCV
jgi:hypothetical protein